MADYYGGNPLAEIKALRARIEVLERAAAAREAPFAASATDAAPEGELPTATDVPALYLVEERSGDIYRLVCIRDGRARLFLRRVSRLRGE